MTHVVTQSFCTMLLLCSHAGSYLISDADGLGRVFDGIGAVSGGSVSIMLRQSLRSGCLIHNSTYLTLSLTLTITLTLPALLTLILDTVVNKAPTSQWLPHVTSDNNGYKFLKFSLVLLRWTEPKPRCFATFRRRRHRDVLGLKRHSVCAFWFFY